MGRRTSVWPDQRGQEAGSVPIARPGEGERGMAPDVHHPQPSQTVQGIAGAGLRASLRTAGLQANQFIESPAAMTRLGRAQRATYS